MEPDVVNRNKTDKCLTS